MNRLELSDLLQRKINSILFRFLIIFYSAFILYSQEQFIKFPYFLLIAITYLLVFLKLEHNSYLRLLNDFLYINIVVWKTNSFTPLEFVFILLPIINAINFSGDKRSPLVYILTALTIILNQYTLNDHYQLTSASNLVNLFAPITALWLINYYTHQRTKIRFFKEELNTIVDNYYLQKDGITRPHKIYKQIANKIHEYLNINFIKDIICIAPTNANSKTITIVNGSTFIYQITNNEPDLIKTLQDKRQFFNAKIELDRKPYYNNIIFYTKTEDQEYYYIFILNKTLPVYYRIIGFFKLLEPCFTKISCLLLSEKRIQEIKNEEILKLSQKSNYINKANKTMHFIRNRLGPFANLLKMLENFPEEGSSQANTYKLLIMDESERARNELQLITKRATEMLEKAKTPFVYTNLEKISISKVFTLLKRNVHTFFPNIELSIDTIPETNDKYVQLNEEGFELFLSDWLSNIKKYYDDKFECNFTLDNETIEISFTNNTKISDIEIALMINDLNSDQRNEIMMRTTHGLYTIKSTLEDMQIQYLAKSNPTLKEITLEIKIKIDQNENSYI